MMELLVSAFAILVVLGVVALAAVALGLVSVREFSRARTRSTHGPALDKPVHEDDPADPVVR